MKNRTFKEFNDSLNWETRILVLLAVAMIAGSYLFESWDARWSVAALFAMVVVMGVEVFSTMHRKHPRTWKAIVWTVILLMLGMLLIGADLISA